MIEITARGASFHLLSREVAQVNARLRRELQQAARRVGATVSGEAKRVMQEDVYNVPIPLKSSADRKLAASAKIRTRTTKGKHGQWRRTGNLKRQENWLVEAESGGINVILVNNAAYAAARSDLGTSRSSRQPRGNTRSVQWQEEAVRRRRDWIRDQYQEAIRRALGSLGGQP